MDLTAAKQNNKTVIGNNESVKDNIESVLKNDEKSIILKDNASLETQVKYLDKKDKHSKNNKNFILAQKLKHIKFNFKKPLINFKKKIVKSRKNKTETIEDDLIINDNDVYEQELPVKTGKNSLFYEGQEYIKVKKQGVLKSIFSNFFVKLLLLTILFAGTAFYAFTLGKTISDTENYKNKLAKSEVKNNELKAQLASLEALKIKSEGQKNSSSSSVATVQNYGMGINGVFTIKDFPTFSIELGDKWSTTVTDENGVSVPVLTPNPAPIVNERNLTFTSENGSVIIINLNKNLPAITGVKCWEEKQVLDIGSGWYRAYESGSDRYYVKDDKDNSGYGLIVPANNQECKNQKKAFAQGFLYTKIPTGGTINIKASFPDASKSQVDNIIKSIKI